MRTRRKYQCDICGKKVPEECLEHLRIFHPEEYSFKKMEFIETAVIIGLDSIAANKTIKRMSGEDLERAIREEKLEKKIPRSYDRLRTGWKRDRAKRWYMQKLLIDERAKSLIRILSKRLSKITDIGNAEKIAINLVNRYTKKGVRSCYDERIIALSAFLVACKFCQKEMDKSMIEKLILGRNADPKEFFRTLNWMEKQLMPDKAYLDLLLRKIHVKQRIDQGLTKIKSKIHFKQSKLDDLIE